MFYAYTLSNGDGTVHLASYFLTYIVIWDPTVCIPPPSQWWGFATPILAAFLAPWIFPKDTFLLFHNVGGDLRSLQYLLLEEARVLLGVLLGINKLWGISVASSRLPDTGLDATGSSQRAFPQRYILTIWQNSLLVAMKSTCFVLFLLLWRGLQNLNLAAPGSSKYVLRRPHASTPM